jgi:GNAT superfamily N-acetyltransferase
MEHLTVRAAVPGDWPTIVDFNCRLAEESENTRLDPAKIRPGVQALLADPAKGRYLVACSGERIVGQLMHTFEWSDWRNGQIWWLQSVFVEPEFRRKGVFRRLFQHLHDAAAADPGVVGFRLYVERENHRAQQTYIQVGLEPAAYFVMERLFER